MPPMNYPLLLLTMPFQFYKHGLPEYSRHQFNVHECSQFEKATINYYRRVIIQHHIQGNRVELAHSLNGFHNLFCRLTKAKTSFSTSSSPSSSSISISTLQAFGHPCTLANKTYSTRFDVVGVLLLSEHGYSSDMKSVQLRSSDNLPGLKY